MKYFLCLVSVLWCGMVYSNELPQFEHYNTKVEQLAYCTGVFLVNENMALQLGKLESADKLRNAAERVGIAAILLEPDTKHSIISNNAVVLYKEAIGGNKIAQQIMVNDIRLCVEVLNSTYSN